MQAIRSGFRCELEYRECPDQGRSWTLKGFNNNKLEVQESFPEQEDHSENRPTAYQNANHRAVLWIVSKITQDGAC